MIDAQKILSESQVVLLLVPSSEYNELVVQNARQLSNKTVCYVTLNKTFDSMKEIFKEKKISIDNFVFVDAISKTIRRMPDQSDGCYFVSSPNSLTELEIAIIKLQRHGFEYLVFDSLSTMLVYQKNIPVAKFVSALANNARKNDTKAIFYMVKSSDQADISDQVGAFVDKVIDLGK